MDNRMTPLRVFSNDRRERKAIVASSFEMLKQKCCEKFNLTELKLVLNEDGCEIDGDFFLTLEPNTQLMVLGTNQEWYSPSGVASDHKTGSDVSARLNSIFEKLKKKKKATPTPLGIESKVNICVGWQHHIGDKYMIMRASSRQPNIGPRSVQVTRTSSYDDLLKEFSKLFFPNGNFFKGSLNSMSLLLGNAEGDVIPKIPFSVDQFCLSCPTQRKRLYLLTKAKDEFESDESCESDELPEINLSDNGPAAKKQAIDLSTHNLSNLTEIGSINGMESEVFTHSLTRDASTPSFVNIPGSSTGPVFIDAGTPTIQFKTPGSGPETCTICQDRPKNAFLIPCGHAFCMVRATHFENSKICPLCREIISRVNNIF